MTDDQTTLKLVKLGVEAAQWEAHRRFSKEPGWTGPTPERGIGEIHREITELRGALNTDNQQHTATGRAAGQAEADRRFNLTPPAPTTLDTTESDERTAAVQADEISKLLRDPDVRRALDRIRSDGARFQGTA